MDLWSSVTVKSAKNKSISYLCWTSLGEQKLLCRKKVGDEEVDWGRGDNRACSDFDCQLQFYW